MGSIQPKDDIHERRSSMLLVRRIGLAILAVAAIAVFFLMAPEVTSESLTGALNESIDFAEEIYSANADRTENAPQQQVVNGWYANDLLNVIARAAAQSPAQSTDDRTAALLVIAVLAIALWGATSVGASPAGAAPETDRSLPMPIPEPPRSTDADEASN
jgi:hypothetical protein